MLIRNWLIASALTALSLAAQPVPAYADGSASSSCLGILSANAGCASGSVTVAVSVDGQPGAVSLVSDGGGTAPVCTYRGQVLACEGPAGWWAADRGCYVRAKDVSPSDPAFLLLSHGQTTGQIYSCTLPPGVAGPPTDFWSATPLAAPDQASVVALAGRAVQSLGLRGVSVGMTPPVVATKPDSVGLIALPNWLWVQDPSAQTWGPASGTSTDGGLSVTVTAKVGKVTWDLGDDSAAIVCTVAGTPYDASFGASQSPDCGRDAGYAKAGTYPVTAVSHWVIAYTSNVGVTGTLTMDLTAASTVTIAEAQVINT